MSRNLKGYASLDEDLWMENCTIAWTTRTRTIPLTITITSKTCCSGDAGSDLKKSGKGSSDIKSKDCAMFHISRCSVMCEHSFQAFG